MVVLCCGKSRACLFKNHSADFIKLLFVSRVSGYVQGNEFGHPEWIDFPRDDTYDTSTGAFVPGERKQAHAHTLSFQYMLCCCLALLFKGFLPGRVVANGSKNQNYFVL
jgi:hypothetical protein